MNVIDILLILMLFAAIAIGFFQGTIKLLIATMAFYVSIVLASLYFQMLGRFFRDRMGTTLSVGQVTAFAIILVFGFVLLTIAGLYTFRYARIPPSLDLIDKVAGTLVGLVLGALAIGMTCAMLQALFVYQNPAALLSWPLMRGLQSGVRGSVLVAFFADNILPLIFQTVRPLLPNEADLIFRLR